MVSKRRASWTLHLWMTGPRHQRWDCGITDVAVGHSHGAAVEYQSHWCCHRGRAAVQPRSSRGALHATADTSRALVGHCPVTVLTLILLTTQPPLDSTSVYVCVVLAYVVSSPDRWPSQRPRVRLRVAERAGRGLRAPLWLSQSAAKKTTDRHPARTRSLSA